VWLRWHCNYAVYMLASHPAPSLHSPCVNDLRGYRSITHRAAVEGGAAEAEAEPSGLPLPLHCARIQSSTARLPAASVCVRADHVVCG